MKSNVAEEGVFAIPRAVSRPLPTLINRHPDASGLVGAVVALALFASFASSAVGQLTLVVHPVDPTVADGATVGFNGVFCPFNLDGSPDFGSDGLPVTPDDICRPAFTAGWSVTGSGSLNPLTLSGPTTLFTANANGQPTSTAILTAQASGQTAENTITVIGPVSSGRAVFLDNLGQETSDVTAVQASLGRARATARLTRQIEQFQERGFERRFLTAIYTNVLVQILPANTFHRGAGLDLSAPPMGPVPATVTSLAADGSTLDQLVIDLQPDGSTLRQPDQFLVMPDDLFDVDGFGEFDFDTTGFELGDVAGFVFVAGEVGGTLTIEAPGLTTGVANVVAPPSPASFFPPSATGSGGGEGIGAGGGAGGDSESLAETLATLTITGIDHAGGGAGVTIAGSATTDGLQEELYGAAGGTGSASVVAADPSALAVGEGISQSADSTGSAAAPGGFALADVVTDGGVTIVNDSTDDVTVSFSFDYAITAEANVADADAQLALAEAFVEVRTESGGELLSDQVESDTDLGGGPANLSDTFTFDVLVSAGSRDEVITFVDSSAVALALGVPGDYNADGVVNAADYTVWRDNLGAPEGTLINDIDDVSIGQAQYATWKANFGTTGSGSEAGTTVPEPATLAMLLMAVAATLCRRSPVAAHAFA